MSFIRSVNAIEAVLRRILRLGMGKVNRKSRKKQDLALMLRASAQRAADAALATPDEGYQAHGFGSGDFGFDPGQRFLQLQIGTVKDLIGALEDADDGGAITGPFEPDHV